MLGVTVPPAIIVKSWGWCCDVMSWAASQILASCSLAASAELQMMLQIFVACKMIVEMHTTIQQNRMWCFCLLSSALAAIELPSLFFSCTLPLRQVTCGTNGLWSLDRHRNSIHKACKRHSIHNACIACVTLI